MKSFLQWVESAGMVGVSDNGNMQGIRSKYVSKTVSSVRKKFGKKPECMFMGNCQKQAEKDNNYFQEL
jgi:hypothetical protein